LNNFQEIEERQALYKSLSKKIWDRWVSSVNCCGEISNRFWWAVITYYVCR